MTDHEHTDHRIGTTLDNLGVRHCTSQPGELISDALVILKTVDEEGRARLTLLWSDGMSWIERVGMLRIAEQQELDDISDRPPDDA